MDIERSIITICASMPEQGYPEAFEMAITPEIMEPPLKEVWAFAQRYMQAHGRGPSVDAIMLEYPEFEPCAPTEPLSYYAEVLKRKFAFNTTLKAIKGAYEDLNKREIDSAMVGLREALRTIDDCTSNEADLDWNATTQDRYNRYLNVKDLHGIDGYRTPFPTLDEATQGIHDGEFVLVVARQGVGKTWLLNLLAHKHINEGLKVLFFTKEMPSKQVARRFDALQFKLPYQDLRSGSLNSHIEAKWQKEAEQVQVPGSLHIVGEESGGVSHVAAKIERYKPDVIYIDGMYLMDDDQRARDSWLRIGNISRALKKLAKSANIPIIASVQFNRQASRTEGDASNIASGDIAKDADLILGLFQSEDQFLQKQITLKVLKQREGQRPEIDLDWDIGQMQFGEAVTDTFEVTF